MEILVPAMSRDEATKLTDLIRGAAEDLWKLLHEAHERKAWQALGYSSWAAYVETEFDMTRQHANRLVAQAEIVKELEAASGTRVFQPPPVRDVYEVRERLPEIVADVKDAVADGVAPEQAVQEAIELANNGVCEVRDRSADQSPEEIAQDFIRVVARTLEFHALDLANTENKADNAVSRLGRVLDWVARFADNDSTMVSTSRIVQRKYEEA